MIDAIQRSGQAIDIEAKENDGIYSDRFLAKDETVNVLVTRANRGDQEVLNQVETGNVITWFARVQLHVKCADVCSAITAAAPYAHGLSVCWCTSVGDYSCPAHCQI